MADLKILAVDDSATMRRILKNTLSRAGYTDVVEADDGVDAWAKLQAGGFNFIITDWNMPNMSGLELVNAIRESEKFKQIPIIMVTTRSVKDDIVAAMKAGANNYVVKPFTPDTLKEKIASVLASL
ncbi:MAG: response regulator [Candidatus Latescibacteria bacterium]|nr:response regulator [Candidatus Latescibacterota bacterium]MCK5381942.1 response regulator [Candidatus Latescibacterota bacterium]MCK5734144.1 response regulator [Candidatus Latescibacterota bacterium]